MRHQATRPSFTVELKRRRSKSPHPFTTPEGHSRESLRREGVLAAFRHEPPAQHSVDWSDLIKVSPPREHTPSFTETPAAESTTKFRTGRILPDVLGAQVAAERIQQKANERAVEGCNKPSKPDRDARPRQPKGAVRKTAMHVGLSGTTRVSEISALPSADSAEGDVTASTMIPTGNRLVAVGQNHERAKDKRVLSGAQRRAKRHCLPIPLRRSERWKRRLPEVCW